MFTVALPSYRVASTVGKAVANGDDVSEPGGAKAYQYTRGLEKAPGVDDIASLLASSQRSALSVEPIGLRRSWAYRHSPPPPIRVVLGVFRSHRID